MRYSASLTTIALHAFVVLFLSVGFLPGFLASDAEAASVGTMQSDVQPITSTSSLQAAGYLPTVTLTQSDESLPSAPLYPAHISIPRAGINSPVVALGKNSKGEMAVPSGSTNDVGWYKYGTQPGALGMAVFDAHVFAAFKNLRYAAVGDDVYVSDAEGTQLHFKVTATKVFALKALSPQILFGSHGAREINLITCAGTYIRSWGTYDHRLVVTATLVE